MKSLSNWDILFTCLVFGTIGGLLGFGYAGTIQKLCLGAGIGAAIPVVLLIVVTFFGDSPR